MAQKKQPLGPVKAEKKPYLWRNLFEHKVLTAFDGQKPTEETLRGEEGQGIISTAKADTTTALGYTLEEATKEDEVSDLVREIRWNRERSGREELVVDSPEEIM